MLMLLELIHCLPESTPRGFKIRYGFKSALLFRVSVQGAAGWNDGSFSRSLVYLVAEFG